MKHANSGMRSEDSQYDIRWCQTHVNQPRPTQSPPNGGEQKEQSPDEDWETRLTRREHSVAVKPTSFDVVLTTQKKNEWRKMMSETDISVYQDRHNHFQKGS